jgi:hypothetical protein
MAAKTFSIEDVIADEVQKAVSATRPAAPVFGVPGPVHTGELATGGGIAGLDIKSITGLLKEINIMLQSRKDGAPTANSGAPVVNYGAPPPAGLPGVDFVPAQNPRPAGTDAPGGLAGYEPEKVCDMIRGALSQVKTAIGDVTLSELDGFIEANRAVVVALISQEMQKL